MEIQKVPFYEKIWGRGGVNKDIVQISEKFSTQIKNWTSLGFKRRLKSLAHAAFLYPCTFSNIYAKW